MGCSKSKESTNSNIVNNNQELDNYLLETGSLDTPLFTLEGRNCKAKCVKCYDADTIHIVIYYGNQLQRFVCRLLGIDSAEIRTSNKSEKEHAIKARDYLSNLILNKIIDIKCNKFDKYGRLLITIYYNDININEQLVQLNYAYEYDGKTKKEFSEWSNTN